MKIFIKIFLIILILSSQVFSQEKVESIKVILNISGTTLPDEVSKRIEESVQAVAEKSILHRDIQEIKMVKISLERVLQKVFNQVLSGFYVLSVSLDIAKETTVKINFASSENIVKNVKVKIDLSLVHPRWQSLLEENLQFISSSLNPLLFGVPVESAEWSQYVIKGTIQTLIQVNAFFPGFNVDVDLQFGEETYVILKLKPKEPLVRKIDLRIYSLTIPNFLLKQVKEILSSYLDLVVGLPQEFVKSKEDYLQSELKRILSEADLKKYNLTGCAFFKVEETFSIIIRLDSLKYQSTLEALINFGQEKTSLEGRVFIAKMLTKNECIFSRFHFYPSNLLGSVDVGIGRQTQESFLSIYKDINNSESFSQIVWSNDKYRLEYIRSIEKDKFEVNFSYLFSSYLNIGAAKDRDNYFGRLVIKF